MEVVVFLFKTAYICGLKKDDSIMEDHLLQSLDLSMFRVNDTAVSMGNKLVAFDNLEDSTADKVMTLVPQENFPKKCINNVIVLVLKGRVCFNVNFREYEVTAGSCVAVISGTIIDRVRIDDDTRIIALSFSQYEMPVMSSSQQRNAHRIYALQVIVVSLMPLQIEMLLSTYKMLCTILTDPMFAAQKEETASHCVYLMTSIIENGSSSQKEWSTKSSRKDEIVSRFLQCVNENYRDRRDLGFYAESLGLSLKYMSHVVFEQTGRHPSQWIKDYVILDAKAMLRSGRYTVQQVADDLHFPNQSFFGKYFKEAVGVSPKKWK